RARRGIPVRIRLADGEAEPVVRRVGELLAAEPSDAPATAAFERAVATAMSELIAHADADLASPEPSLDRALDALVAFSRAATAWVDQQLRGDATVAALQAALADHDLLDGDGDADADSGNG